MLAMTTVADPDEQLSAVDPSQAQIELMERYSAHNYHPLPVVVADGEGAWVTDVEGKRYLDMLAAYSALNFGHRHPDLVAAARDAARPRHAHLARVPQRQARPVLQGARRALRHGDGAAHEHRRRGRRDRAEDRASMGLRRQGRAGGPREDRHVQRQLPRPHDRDRELLDRPGRARWLRPVHAGVRDRALRRHRRAGCRARRPRRRGVPGRTDPGRGRGRGAARRVPAARS